MHNSVIIIIKDSDQGKKRKQGHGQQKSEKNFVQDVIEGRHEQEKDIEGGVMTKLNTQVPSRSGVVIDKEFRRLPTRLGFGLGERSRVPVWDEFLLMGGRSFPRATLPGSGGGRL